MSTYRDVIEQALQELGVIHATESPSGDESEDARVRMNQMMTGFIHDGIDMEFESVTDIDANVPYPDSLIAPLASNLAMRMAPMYGITPSPVLVALAQQGRRYLWAYFLKIEPAGIDPAIQTTWNPNFRFL